MIKITKDEMNYLVSNGVKWGENGISHTYTKYHHYYMTESQKNIRLLKNYRESRLVKG